MLKQRMVITFSLFCDMHLCSSAFIGVYLRLKINRWMVTSNQAGAMRGHGRHGFTRRIAAVAAFPKRAARADAKQRGGHAADLF